MTRPTARRRVSRLRAPRTGRSASHELADLLVEVWRQVVVDGLAEIKVGRRRLPVEFTKTKHLRTVEVSYGSLRLFGIEQNPRTASRWAKLAREGKRIMQFNAGGRYVANVCEGKVFRYPAWRAMGLPE
ncbi:MAG TPA: hypothetical protein VJT33_06470 [bacterium]|nr:hypothetical protein [bacterium]